MRQLESLQKSLKYEGGISRRWFMAYGAALASIPWMNRATAAQARPRFVANPFTLGVASGDPDSSSVVLWTRLAPRPLEPFGGMSKEAVEVHWVIADDDNNAERCRQGRRDRDAAIGSFRSCGSAGLEA